MSQYDEGYITAEERKEAVTSCWDSATEEVGQAMEGTSTSSTRST